MNSAFEWLNQLMQAFGKLIPRLVLIRTTYVGVLFERQGTLAILPPGLTWYWPVTTEIRKMPSTVRAWNIDHVAVKSRLAGPWDLPVTTIVSATLHLRLVNARQAIELFDLRRSVMTTMRQILANEYETDFSKHEYEKACRGLIETWANRYGLELVHFGLIDHAEVVLTAIPNPGDNEWSILDRDTAVDGD